MKFLSAILSLSLIWSGVSFASAQNSPEEKPRIMQLWDSCKNHPSKCIGYSLLTVAGFAAVGYGIYYAKNLKGVSEVNSKPESVKNLPDLTSQEFNGKGSLEPEKDLMFVKVSQSLPNRQESQMPEIDGLMFKKGGEFLINAGKEAETEKLLTQYPVTTTFKTKKKNGLVMKRIMFTDSNGTRSYIRDMQIDRESGQLTITTGHNALKKHTFDVIR